MKKQKKRKGRKLQQLKRYSKYGIHTCMYMDIMHIGKGIAIG